MPTPSLYLIRQDRLGVPHYIADEVTAVDDAVLIDRFAWTEDRSKAMQVNRSVARRLAAIVGIDSGRSAMVLPVEDDGE